MAETNSTEITRKVIREHVHQSIAEVLKSLHIQTESKKVQKLVDRSSKKIAGKALKEFRKEEKRRKKELKKVQKKKANQPKAEK